MEHRCFSDFEEYAGAIQNVDLRCLVTGVKRLYWFLYHREVGSIQIQGGFKGCPVIVEGATHRGQWVFYLQRNGDFGYVNGLRLDAD